MSERARLASQMLHKIKPPVRNEAVGAEAVEVPSFEHLRLTRDEERVATEAYRKTVAGAELTKPEQFALEAIILPDIRPAIDIRYGAYAEVTHPEWRRRLNDATTMASPVRRRRRRAPRRMLSASPFSGRRTRAAALAMSWSSTRAGRWNLMAASDLTGDPGPPPAGRPRLMSMSFPKAEHWLGYK